MSNSYINLAKQAIETYVKTGKIIDVPKDLPEEFYSRQAGVFVTIKKGKELKGCIGTYLPTRKNIAEEIISNAISSCSQDYRFLPVNKEELSELNYEVSILSEPEQIKEIKELDAKKYGVLVKTQDGRSGLLLPDLEGVDTPHQQISIACQKAKINSEKDQITIYRFTVEKFI